MPNENRKKKNQLHIECKLILILKRQLDSIRQIDTFFLVKIFFFFCKLFEILKTKIIIEKYAKRNCDVLSFFLSKNGMCLS